MLLRRSLFLALVLGGCNLGSCEPSVDPGLAIEEPEEWPTARIADLPSATPATELTVRADAIEIDNRALIATWPEDAVRRAHAEGDEWPRITRTIDVSSQEGLTIPELRGPLEDARRAERAATGAGSGAGAFNVRIESRVPFATFERVLMTAGLAGYGLPRVLLRDGDEERMFSWPESAPPETRARVVVTPTTVELFDGENARALCSIRADEPSALDLCATSLRQRSPDASIELAPDVTFGRAIAIVQPISRIFERVRVSRRSS